MEDQVSRVVSVICVIRSEGEYLLVQRSFRDSIFPGLWQNVGGKLESGERVEDALRREIQEEIGLDVGDNPKYTYLCSYSWRKDGEDSDRLGLIFLLDLPHKPARISLSSELTKYEWFGLEDTIMVPTIGVRSHTGTLAQLKFAYMA